MKISVAPALVKALLNGSLAPSAVFKDTAGNPIVADGANLLHFDEQVIELKEHGACRVTWKHGGMPLCFLELEHIHFMPGTSFVLQADGYMPVRFGE